MKKRIVIIDDEAEMLRFAADLLAADGHAVRTFSKPNEGLAWMQSSPPDLVLLDVRMPGMDGFQVCKALKSETSTRHIPIILLSVQSTETDVVLGLELGAEDYIRKPFRKRELLARVKTALRRSESSPKVRVMEAGPIRVDLDSYKAWVAGQKLKLSPKEFQLLAVFLQNESRVLTRSVLAELVWGIEYVPTSRTIDVHVEQLRRKLGPCGPMLQSLKGVGYRFEDPD